MLAMIGIVDCAFPFTFVVAPKCVVSFEREFRSKQGLSTPRVFHADNLSLIRIYGTVVNFNYTHSNANSLATLVVAIYTTRAFCHRRQ